MAIFLDKFIFVSLGALQGAFIGWFFGYVGACRFDIKKYFLDGKKHYSIAMIVVSVGVVGWFFIY